MNERPSHEYIPVESLPPEEKEGILGLETKTDEVYRLRGELAVFYRDYGLKYVRRVDVPGEKKFAWRLTVKDISTHLMSGGSPDDLIADEAILETLKKEGVAPSAMEMMREVRHDEIEAALALAVQSYQALEREGGSFGNRKESDEEKDIKAYYDMRWGELGAARRSLDEARAAAALLEQKMDYVRSDPRASRRAPEVLRLYETQYREQFLKIKKLTEENPEAYFLVRAEELRDARETYDAHGTIVETPYVKSKLAHMRDLARRSRPIFIHGELGSGKTELAKHFARRELSAAHVARWEAAHPAPADKEGDAYRDWTARRTEEVESLIIPGYKGIEAEQLIAARSVTVKETPPPEEQAQRISEGWKTYRERLVAELESQKLSDAEFKTQIKKIDTADRGLYERAYLEAFRTPVETGVVLAPVLRAMREGRPVIIDEMNAIPHHALIILNDYLLKKPGDWVTPPIAGAESFQVQEGFTVIATGNYKPEDGKMYVGRQPIDAAFLSRWGLISYDYLPMSRELEAPGMPPERLREVRAENELHHMLVTRLLNNDLGARLPEGAIEELRTLAVVARNLEDIFAGKDIVAYYADQRGVKIKAQDVLKENVLSIRHLLPIIDQWKADGFMRPLADYLFLEYIDRSNARPAEKTYLYQILQTQGDFFSEGAGWPIFAQSEKVLAYPIEQKMYGTAGIGGLRAPLQESEYMVRTYSPIEVIEALYGPRPARIGISSEFVRRKEKKPEVDDLEKLERARLLDELFGMVDKLSSEGYLKSENR